MLRIPEDTVKVTPPLLTLEDVSRQFPGFLLDRVSFRLEPGYVMGLIGPNGAGKTTLIKLMLNLLRPSAGTITIFGLDHRRHEVEVKKQLGYVGERAHYPPEATAEWVGRFMAQWFPTWDDALYRSYLNRFAVPPRGVVRTLSKGQVTKLALAAAMGHRPRLLILDEPTSGLDPLVRREVVGALREVVRDEGRSVLFSTHILSDLESLADYITVLAGGHLITSESMDTLADRWKRLTYTCTPGPRPQGSSSVITGDFGPDLVNNIGLATPSTGPVEVASLSLEEILAQLVHAGSAPPESGREQGGRVERQ